MFKKQELYEINFRWRRIGEDWQVIHLKSGKCWYISGGSIECPLIIALKLTIGIL